MSIIGTIVALLMLALFIHDGYKSYVACPDESKSIKIAYAAQGSIEEIIAFGWTVVGMAGTVLAFQWLIFGLGG